MLALGAQCSVLSSEWLSGVWGLCTGHMGWEEGERTHSTGRGERCAVCLSVMRMSYTGLSRPPSPLAGCCWREKIVKKLPLTAVAAPALCPVHQLPK